MECRICSNKNPIKFLSFGQIPLANSFLSKEELIQNEEKYPLDVFFCNNCTLVQLGYVVPSETMFKKYLYLSSTTDTFRQHFTKMAEHISEEFKYNDKSLAVDIGSNDGILLSGFKKIGIRVIGVEPAENIARVANEKGIFTINDFFNENTVKIIIQSYGHADIVTATNVFGHVNNIKEFIENVKHLLGKNGIFVIEIQYLVDTIEKMTFDNIYHEHLSYFSLTSLNFFFQNHEMEIFKVERVETHGGSLRVFAKKKDWEYKIHNSVKKILEHEKKIRIDNYKIYKEFAERVNNIRVLLRDKIISLKSDSKLLAGYGAPAKCNTLLNFCQIDNKYIEYIIDDNPLKIGLFTPGTHIPVVSSAYLDEKIPDYLIIFAWNFAAEIMAKTKKYAEAGVKFIIPLPQPTVL